MKPHLFLFIFVLFSASANAQVYNTTNLTNASNLYEYAYETNILLEYTIGMGILLIMFVLPFVVATSRGYSSGDGAILGSFMTGITAVIFLPLGLITMSIFQTTILICAAFTALSFFFTR